MRCKRCCITWLRYRDGQVQRGCPHCGRLVGKHDEADGDLARRQIAASQKAHADTCPIPVRWEPKPVAQTPVETARPASAAVRASRMRYAGR